jgi:3'-phosphoadenosine 5'-phosphosulfate sulfotransferase (PAPS reductase)/FAD synthetase
MGGAGNSLNIVSLSGGKDSSALLLMMMERDIPVHKIVFADVGEMAEFDEMYDYLERIEAYTGLKVTRIRSERHTARSIFFGRFTRGKRAGEMRGFPPTVGQACGYRRDLKVNPLSKACGSGNNVFIGFAADESHRSRAKQYTAGYNNYCFPLVDWGVTEAGCMDYLKERGLYNGLYDYFDRIGCWWCPKQPIASLRSLYWHFPDKWKQLRELEEIHGKPFKHGYPAYELEPRFIREAEEEKIRRENEDAQLCLYDNAAGTAPAGLHQRKVA